MFKTVLSRYLTILFFTLIIGLLHKAKSFSQQINIQIDTSDYLPLPDGINTNLMIAASKGYVLEVHRLIKLGADIDCIDYDGLSSLIFAVANQKQGAVKAILSYDPEIDQISNKGETALHITAKDNQPDIGEILLRAGADINIKDNHKASPLHYAAIYGYFYFTDLMLYYNADIESRAEDGSTPLLSAVWAGYPDITDMLLLAGSNPDAKDNDGFTPLIIAAQNADTLILNLLIDAGANLYSVNNYGYDALGMAIKKGHLETVQYLQKFYDHSRKDENSLSPILIARKYGRAKIVEELKRSGLKEDARLSFDQVRIKAGIKTALLDTYYSLGLSLKEPKLKLFLNTGIELKSNYSRVIVQESDNSFVQYYDRRYVLFVGAGKEFLLLEEYIDGTISFDFNINLGYMMTSKYKGTNIKAPDKIRFMPSAALRWNKSNYNISIGYDYMNTDLYRIGPHWFNLSLLYDIYFDKLRGPIKNIRWY